MDGDKLMPTAETIEKAVRSVKDQSSFINLLLKDALEWHLGDTTDLEEITFEWSAEELEIRQLAEGLSIKQIRPLAENPWNIFLLEFGNRDPFTSGRGFTTPLRRLLRTLVSKQRADNLPAFRRDNLLFICTYRYEDYRFAYFQPQVGTIKTPPLAMFGWEKDDTALRTLCEYNLKGLFGSNEKGEWAHAFDVKKFTDEFYKEYKTVYDQVEERIKQKNTLAEADLHLYTQTLFNRLMFLRFVERKGWLVYNGHQKDYLASLIRAGGINGKTLYASRLRELFFSGLAIEGQQESQAIGKVPFLNGGLFEEKHTDLIIDDLSDDVFEPIIGERGLFYRFNFTIQESTPFDIEVAVDPEMLGKVFERLVTYRKKTGAYYTPREIVSFMCKETMKGYLKNYEQLVDEHDATRISVPEARELLKRLKSVKVVDPACGSGAYLVGMLHELEELNQLLDTRSEVSTPRNKYELKRDIIQTNLYGVDINDFATNIAALRLWLSLAVEYEGVDPQPLPNLDYKIGTQDSLTAPDPQKDIQLDAFREDEVRAFAKAKAEHSKETDPQKKAELRKIITEHRNKIAQWKHPNVKVEGFDWTVEFAEVFLPAEEDRSLGGGFDIVIANPPYGVDVLDKVRDQFFNPKKDGSQSKDSYGIFMARGLQLLRKGGQFSFIVSDTWRTIKSHLPLRKRILSEATVKHVLDLPSWIFDATVNTGILTLVKDTASKDHKLIAGDLRALPKGDWESLRANLVAVAHHGFDAQTLSYGRYTYPQVLLTSFERVPFFIASPSIFKLLFSGNLLFLESLPAEVRKGIDTGDNPSFLYQDHGARGSYRTVERTRILTEYELVNLTEDEKLHGVNPENYSGRHLIPYDKGGESDVADGWLPNYWVPTSYFIDWSRDSVQELRLRTRRQSGHHKATIRNEKYWFNSGVTFSLTGQYCPTVRISSGGMFDNNGSIIFTDSIPPEQLLGILGSKWHRYTFKSYIDHTVHAHVDDFKKIPIAKDNLEVLKEVEAQVKSIIGKQKTSLRYTYHDLEQREIDRLVNRLYELCPNDIREIELWFCRRYPKLAEAQGLTAEVKKKYADYLLHCDFVLSKPPSYWHADPVLLLIAEGEGQRLEFKETLEWDIRQQKGNRELHKEICKTVCALANADGGTLLIGVADSGEIKGLERDFGLCKAGKQNRDGFQLKLQDLLREHLSPLPINSVGISFCDFAEGVICKVDVKPSRKVVHIDAQDVYVRFGNQSLKLTGQQLTEWIEERTSEA